MLPAADRLAQSAPSSTAGQKLRRSTWIVVPAFNEQAAIGEVVRHLKRFYPEVVVVDDGSVDATAAAARGAGATVLRHVVNRGQGAALQTGIDHALRAGAAYVVTFDSDGQHRPEDVERLLAPLADGSADFALGSRFLGSAEGISTGRRWVLRAAVSFTRWTSGLAVTDAHNGLRAISRRGAEALRFRQDRMAHASELLDQIRESRLPFVEVPVRIRYTGYSRAKGQRPSAAVRILADYFLGRWLD